jgi:hypothetical protein
MHPTQKHSLESMSPEQKLQTALDLYHSAWELKAAWLQQQHPDWDKEKVQKEVREIFLHAPT